MRDSLPSLLQTISGNVQRLRSETERTQRMVSGSGLSQKTVSNLSRMGITNPKRGSTIGTLHAAAEQLGVPAYQMMIANLPDSSECRNQLDRLVRAFVDADPRQRAWLLETVELMGRTGPPKL